MRRFPCVSGLLAASLLLLSACAALSTRLERPILRLVGVELAEVGLLEQRFVLTFSAQNPNAVAVPVKGLSYAVQLAGRDLARGVSPRSFSVPAYGETRFQVEASTSLFGIARHLQSLLQARPETVDYRLSGKLDVDLPFVDTLPFETAGALDLGALRSLVPPP